MTLLREVLATLAGMFAGNIRLSLAVLIVTAAAAALAELTDADPLLAGGVLAVGCPAIVIEGARRAARRAASSRQTGNRA